MKKLISVAALLFSFNSNAAWIDASGAVTSLVTYASTETVLVTLSNAGKDTGCANKVTFAISKDISSEARARMYSMLLAAQSTGRSVVVTYNDTGGCEPWDANQNAYRKIVRLR
ncbi:hypothetical protein tloyanaT_07790 [Thalassotalea loyana]|uniref:DUF3718 domain-containing protein n=1 Tax=Thalassotalea loyana TaxID=280483 RepID=A0ABQ6HCQ6_9GAMM|nr:hypothetical protein [Thalassotalea loyana]GLX84527.1 hypothetical protein tloyanaT_07790 [Thalassotalea loyana]